MMKNKKTIVIICIILAAAIIFSAVSGALLFIVLRSRLNAQSLQNVPVNSQNHVDFREEVHIAEDTSKIQKRYKDVSLNEGVYTLFYKRKLPEFFEGLSEGDVFCVYPDGKSKETFFAQGFCGRLTNVQKVEGGYEVSFTVPELTDVFSDIYLNTDVNGSQSVASASFCPSEIVTDVQCLQAERSAQTRLPSLTYSTLSPIPAVDRTPTVTNLSVKEKLKEAKSASLLEDYTLICDRLKIKFDSDVGDADDFQIGAKGEVILEETAVKMLLDYHYDEATGTAQIKDYSLGFITKQKINLGLSAKKTVGLDDLSFDLSEKTHIIDVVDVTESEKGKIVLGTYLLGLQAPLPILKNSTNKVNYLSFGIAIQLSLTGRGELSLEYDIEESGFVQIEVNGNGENTYLLKGYDYPNPVTESRLPTEEEAASVPSVTSAIKGEAKFNLAVGVDFGVCILGMIPIKLANNLVECEVIKTFSTEEPDDKKTDIMTNNYLSDDCVDSLMVSSNSYLKMHLGAKMNFGLLKMTVAEVGGSVQLFKHVWYQMPEPEGFNHAQCGFGGVFVGETYTDEELDNAYKAYMKATEKNDLFSIIDNTVVNPAVNAALNNPDLGLVDLEDYLSEATSGYQIDFYAAGVMYIRDETDKVTAVIVFRDEITNVAGVHVGLSPTRIEQVYSAPDQSAEANIDLGVLGDLLLGVSGLDEANVMARIYNSSDSSDCMSLFFCDESLKLIVLNAQS